ncbi:hypothetical protein JOM56_000484 [Amanita muscaria]
MPPVLRSFTVFQDAPPVERSSAPRQTKSAMYSKKVTRSSSTNSENFIFMDNPPITVPDKENLHPVTGERAGLGAADKKRKDGGSHVLATKLHNPPTRPVAAKKHKKELSIVLKDEGSPTKKRKASVPSEPSTSSKPRKSGAAKRTTTRTRAIATLPKVAEEEPTVVAQKDVAVNKLKSKPDVTKPVLPQLSQADIDSRCYELTVKPLADVSQAYEDTSPSQDADPRGSKTKFQQVKESSVEPEIRDIYVSTIASSANLQLGSSRKTPFEEPTGSSKTFSTPERKAIYAAFTFSSPSPSGERFSKTTRAGGIPRLELA